MIVYSFTRLKPYGSVTFVLPLRFEYSLSLTPKFTSSFILRGPWECVRIWSPNLYTSLPRTRLSVGYKEVSSTLDVEVPELTEPSGPHERQGGVTPEMEGQILRLHSEGKGKGVGERGSKDRREKELPERER